MHPCRPNVARSRHIIDIESTLPYVKRVSGLNSRVDGSCGRCAATRIKPDARPSACNDETRLLPPIWATRAVTHEQKPDSRRTLAITSKAPRGYHTDQPQLVMQRFLSPHQCVYDNQSILFDPQDLYTHIFDLSIGLFAVICTSQKCLHLKQDKYTYIWILKREKTKIPSFLLFSSIIGREFNEKEQSYNFFIRNG